MFACRAPVFGAAVAARAVRPARRTATSMAMGKTWYPGSVAPKYLENLPGSYGFDPLRLGANADLLPWYAEAELTNGRWAMMAVVGILFTDLVGVSSQWWTAGAATYALDNKTLAAVELVVMGLLEAKRVENFRAKGQGGFLSMAPFDPMGMKSEKTTVNEIKNARLAMLAFLGFASQAAVRGLGPIECLQAHLADPGHVNIFTSSVGTEATVGVIVAAIAPMFLIASRTLGGNTGKEEFRPIPW